MRAAPPALAHLTGHEAVAGLGAVQRVAGDPDGRRRGGVSEAALSPLVAPAVEGVILCGCFAQDARGRWYLNLQREVAADLPTGTGEVGIDLGSTTLATLSDGTKIDREQITARYQGRSHGRSAPAAGSACARFTPRSLTSEKTCCIALRPRSQPDMNGSWRQCKRRRAGADPAQEVGL
ncbi:MAG TPA: hypothetical protein VJX23_02090 [Candidatus Binataceae bacterium]|nr:hypothetical protein [Candidatus Binataceae bacterium]